MHKAQKQVKEFHEAFGCYRQREPGIPNQLVQWLRQDLIQEELDELCEAFNTSDLRGVADALGDLLYVVYGCAEACGLDMEPIVDEIHRSNLTKCGGGRRADGKILKGLGYEPPDLLPIIESQMKS